MSAIFYLSATHSAGNKAGRELLREITAELPKPFRAVHVGCFHNDDRQWTNATIKVLEGLGAVCKAPRFSERTLNQTMARTALEEADFLYLDGGDTIAGVIHIQERGLLKVFQRAMKSTKLVFGLSGGACAAGPYSIGYDKKGKGYVAPCLALGPVLPLDVHDEKADWPEMRALLELGPPQKQGLVLPTNAVLRVGSDGKLSSHGEPSCERRSLAKDGSWVVERL